MLRIYQTVSEGVFPETELPAYGILGNSYPLSGSLCLLRRVVLAVFSAHGGERPLLLLLARPILWRFR